MQYVLMIHAAESRFGAMSKEQFASAMQAYRDYTKDLNSTGRAGDSAALEGTHTATCVSVRDGKRIVKDGPYAETREQLGGYYSLDARSEEEAVDWAAKIPDAKGGSIEVRPLMVMSSLPNADPNVAVDPKHAKEYLLLIYEQEAGRPTPATADGAATLERYLTLRKELIASGQWIAGQRLDGVKKAKSVTVTDKRVVRDGPFAETREQLGGYYRVRAKNLDEAIAIAAKIPAAETGTIEVRPVQDMSKYA